MSAVEVSPVSANTYKIFEDSFTQLRKQLVRGELQPSVAYLPMRDVGIVGIEFLKERLEVCFGIEMDIQINLLANSISVQPVIPDTNDTESANTEHAKQSASNAARKNKSKVTRPLNAFILYRKDWHPIIVAENPGLHNNSISVLIGNKWKAETGEVKEAYRQRAAQDKQLHAKLHPNYTYQPRKPCEKKKRMTRTKLAKMLADGTLPSLELNFESNPGMVSFYSGPSAPGDLTAQISAHPSAPSQTQPPWSLATANFQPIPVPTGPVPAQPQQNHFGSGYLTESVFCSTNEALSANDQTFAFTLPTLPPPVRQVLTPTLAQMQQRRQEMLALYNPPQTDAALSPAIVQTSEALKQEGLNADIGALFDFLAASSCSAESK